MTLPVRIAAFAVLAGAALAQPRAEFEARYWVTEASHRVRIDTPQFGTEIDFKRDLGVDDKSIPDLRFTFHSRSGHRLQFGYWQIDHEGDRNVQRTVEFRNRIYTVGTRIVSDLEIRQVKLGWSYQWDLAGGLVSLGPLVEGHGVWYDAVLEAPALTPPVRAADKRSIGFPAAGAALEVNPHAKVTVFAESAGLSLGKYGYFIGGEGGVRAIPVHRVSVLAGYRVYRINPKFEPDFARVVLSGPFFGASVRF